MVMNTPSGLNDWIHGASPSTTCCEFVKAGDVVVRLDRRAAPRARVCESRLRLRLSSGERRPRGARRPDRGRWRCTTLYVHKPQSSIKIIRIGVNLITFNTICYRVCPCLRLELDRAESLDLYNLNIVSPRYITWCQTPRAEPAAARGLHSSASASRCTAPASGSHAEACSAPPEDITLRPLRL